METEVVAGEVLARVHVVVTLHAIAQLELQEVDPIGLEPLLLVDLPSCRCRPEGSPTMTGGED